MSTILKALKKLEEEKARRQEGGVDLARDILLGEARRQRPPLWPLIVGGGLLLGTLAGALYLSLHPGQPQLAAPLSVQPAARSESMRPQSEAAEEARVETVQIVPVVLSPPSPADQSPSGRTLPLQPVAVVTESAELISPVEAKPAKVPAVLPAAESPSAPKSVERGGGSPPQPAVVEATERITPEASVAEARTDRSEARLVVSGIAFQELREARMAIVNGLPVMEGSTMEGARVVEILVDRVRFSQDGRTFEVSLDAGRP